MSCRHERNTTRQDYSHQPPASQLQYYNTACVKCKQSHHFHSTHQERTVFLNEKLRLHTEKSVVRAGDHMWGSVRAGERPRSPWWRVRPSSQMNDSLPPLQSSILSLSLHLSPCQPSISLILSSHPSRSWLHPPLLLTPTLLNQIFDLSTWFLET